MQSQQRLNPKSATMILILINVLVFFVLDSDSQINLAFDYQQKMNIMTWLTHMFIHGSSTHLFVNMIALASFGINLENRFGARRFLFMYFICGFVALFLQVLGHWNEIGLLVGASGAILGIVGATCYLQPKDKLLLFFVIPIQMKYAFGLTILLSLIFQFTGTFPSVAHFAHIGGLVSGYLMAIFIQAKDIKR